MKKIVNLSLKNEEDGNYSFKYMSAALQDTPDLNILTARNEVNKMGEITKQMFEMDRQLYRNPDKKMGDVLEELKRKEDLTDQMQAELTAYLAECSKEHLSQRGMNNVAALMRIINELENIGDSCYKLGLILQRKYDRKIKLHDKAAAELEDFSDLILEFMDIYQQKMDEHLEKEVLQIAYKLETNINNLRDNLKKGAEKRLQEGANVDSELLYLDILKHFEHIGDNSLNIAQALRKVY